MDWLLPYLDYAVTVLGGAAMIVAQLAGACLSVSAALFLAALMLPAREWLRAQSLKIILSGSGDDSK